MRIKQIIAGTYCPNCEANAKRIEELEEALRELWEDQTMMEQYDILQAPERMPNLAQWLKENDG